MRTGISGCACSRGCAGVIVIAIVLVIVVVIVVRAVVVTVVVIVVVVAVRRVPRRNNYFAFSVGPQSVGALNVNRGYPK
eukprot:9498482-Pyramimonas_sp.AAC.1